MSLNLWIYASSMFKAVINNSYKNLGDTQEGFKLIMNVSVYFPKQIILSFWISFICQLSFSTEELLYRFVFFFTSRNIYRHPAFNISKYSLVFVDEVSFFVWVGESVVVRQTVTGWRETKYTKTNHLLTSHNWESRLAISHASSHSESHTSSDTGFI